MKTNIKWTKAVTRETTLLERYIRNIGYVRGHGSFSRFRISNILTAARQGISEQYFDETQTAQAAKVAIADFEKGKAAGLFKKFETVLRSLIEFKKKLENFNVIKSNLVVKIFKKFIRLYGYGRGVVIYAHFAEKTFSDRIMGELQNKKIRNLDEYFYVLTAPVSGPKFLNKYLKLSGRLRARQKRIAQRLRLNGRQKRLIRYIQNLGYYHETAERVTSDCFKRLEPMLTILSRRRGVSLVDLKCYTPEEVYQLLENKKIISARELALRKNFFLLLVLKGRFRLYTGKPGLLFASKLLPKTIIAKDKMVSGQATLKGKVVRGEVKLVIKQADISKMLKGDILVSPMTTPRLLPAVKLAGAIVTDEGGVTSHAAIVSREFDIPCIIGTKVASVVFKDGDFVEVDTNKGVVKKL